MSENASAHETGSAADAPDAAISTIPDPDPESLEAFWVRARNLGHIYPLEAVLGQDDVSSLRPPAFSFADTPELADRLAELVLEGKKTATSGWRASYEAEGVDLPEAGDLSIMCDGRGEPLALLRNSEVRVLGFQEVDAEISDAEGEGTFDYWKKTHEDFFARECQALGIDYDPEGEVVVEFFDVVYSRDDGGSDGDRIRQEGRASAADAEEDGQTFEDPERPGGSNVD